MALYYIVQDTKNPVIKKGTKYQIETHTCPP